LRNSFAIIAFLLLIIVACRHRESAIIQRGFYYWKTSLALAQDEKNRMEELHVQKLYTRFFDVDVNETGEPMPVAKFRGDSILPSALHIIPVVFITNKTLEKIAVNKIQTLGKTIASLIDKTAIVNKISYSEIQIDCDWNLSTRNRYFSLLQDIRNNLPSSKPVILSCTIRLHQIKYPKQTGVPPVDRGMLMFYNMGEIKDSTRNSIYNEEDASKYTASIRKYKLPLDVALPIFCWVKIFHEGNLSRLLNNTTEAELSDTSFFRRESTHGFRAMKDGFFRGEYIFKNDLLITEETTPEVAKNAAELLARNMTAGDFTVVLYHWDNTNLSRYANRDIEDLYHYFE
jgi:hypothetical protein